MQVFLETYEKSNSGRLKTGEEQIQIGKVEGSKVLIFKPVLRNSN